jgi:hypothetical protein
MRYATQRSRWQTLKKKKIKKWKTPLKTLVRRPSQKILLLVQVKTPRGLQLGRQVYETPESDSDSGVNFEDSGVNIKDSGVNFKDSGVYF